MGSGRYVGEDESALLIRERTDLGSGNGDLGSLERPLGGGFENSPGDRASFLS
jgi:hypothetical protein